MLLQNFSWKVIYISGKSNVVTDVLSRYSLQPPFMNYVDDFTHVLMVG